MMRIFFVFVIFSLLSLSCVLEGTRAPTSSPPIESPITLDFGQSVILTPSNHRLTFDSLIIEARCPSDALCFWQGFAEIRLQAISPKDDTSYIHLIIVGNFGNSELDTLGYRFKLTELSPYPLSTQDVIQENYTAIIEIKPLDSTTNQIAPVIISNTHRQAIELNYFELLQASISNDSLVMTIDYSGGCANHYFELHMSPDEFTKSIPPQADIYLRHFSTPDFCGMLRRNLTFDILPIKERYRELFGRDDDIILNIHNYRDTTGSGDIHLLYPALGID